MKVTTATLAMSSGLAKDFAAAQDPDCLVAGSELGFQQRVVERIHREGALRLGRCRPSLPAG